MAFLIAQATARHSSSTIAYLLSVSDRNLDPACTTRQSELPADCFWRRRKPNPRVLALVYRRVSFEASKYTRTGAVVSDCLAFIKFFFFDIKISSPQR